MEHQLPTAVLGRTGLTVTRLGYGAMEIRGSRIWGGRPVTEAQAQTILNAVVDAGINFIDTANDYGRSEEFIGQYLSHCRSQYYLATKWVVMSSVEMNILTTPRISGPKRICSAACTRACGV